MFCRAIEGFDHLFPSLVHDSDSLFYCHIVCFNIIWGIEGYVVANEDLVGRQAGSLVFPIIVYCRRCR